MNLRLYEEIIPPYFKRDLAYYFYQLLMIPHLVNLGEHDMNRLLEILKLLQGLQVGAGDPSVGWNAH